MQTVVELKNGKQYNVTYDFVKYHDDLKEVLDERKIETIGEGDKFYALKLIGKTMLITFLFFALLFCYFKLQSMFN